MWLQLHNKEDNIYLLSTLSLKCSSSLRHLGEKLKQSRKTAESLLTYFLVQGLQVLLIRVRLRPSDVCWIIYYKRFAFPRPVTFWYLKAKCICKMYSSLGITQTKHDSIQNPRTISPSSCNLSTMLSCQFVSMITKKKRLAWFLGILVERWSIRQGINVLHCGVFPNHGTKTIIIVVNIGRYDSWTSSTLQGALLVQLCFFLPVISSFCSSGFVFYGDDRLGRSGSE